MTGIKKLNIICIKSALAFGILAWALRVAAQPSTPVYYTVKPGEGLYRVAVNNNVTMQEIRLWNSLTSDQLSSGQQLIVGYQSGSSHRASLDKAPQQEYDAGNQPRYYEVQPGEGLYRVAVNNRVTMAEIRSWNNLVSDQLSAGQRLIVGYALPQAGETSEDISVQDIQAEYEAALSKGNMAMDDQRYESAKHHFEEAISINSKSYIAKKRLAEIEIILSRRQSPAAQPVTHETPLPHSTTTTYQQPASETPAVSEVQQDVPPSNPFAAFWYYVKKGDAAMGADSYEEALAHYRQASLIYPAKSYPKARIQEIESTWLKPEPVMAPEPEEPGISQETTYSEATAAQESDPAALYVNEVVQQDVTSTPEPIPSSVEEISLIAFTHFAVIKSKPSDFSKLLDYIPEDSEVTITGFNNNMRDYYHVSYNGLTGWVPEKNIKKTKEVNEFKKQLKSRE